MLKIESNFFVFDFLDLLLNRDDEISMQIKMINKNIIIINQSKVTYLELLFIIYLYNKFD